MKQSFHDRSKSSRVDFRANAHEKEVLHYAASLIGRNMSQFLRETTLKAAHDVIQEHNRVKLSEEDALRVLDAFDNPPQPNASLKKALKKYRSMMKEQNENNPT